MAAKAAVSGSTLPPAASEAADAVVLALLHEAAQCADHKEPQLTQISLGQRTDGCQHRNNMPNVETHRRDTGDESFGG